MRKKPFENVSDDCQVNNRMKYETAGKSQRRTFFHEDLSNILMQIEAAKLDNNYEKCVELYLKATKICQQLGDLEKLIKYAKLAKEYRIKLEESEL
ncbi:MAG: hypothetical protein ACTSO9_15875 [Candidatus Helarchaeota archaeon]